MAGVQSRSELSEEARSPQVFVRASLIVQPVLGGGNRAPTALFRCSADAVDKRRRLRHVDEKRTTELGTEEVSANNGDGDGWGVGHVVQLTMLVIFLYR